ncbi:hypothetical protein Pelo_17992 [Pelomyxa schiedti]|nr:hypothetical protein Pelo_17992 [Pelomyxa schiedti]
MIKLSRRYIHVIAPRDCNERNLVLPCEAFTSYNEDSDSARKLLSKDDLYIASWEFKTPNYVLCYVPHYDGRTPNCLPLKDGCLIACEVTALVTLHPSAKVLCFNNGDYLTDGNFRFVNESQKSGNTKNNNLGCYEGPLTLRLVVFHSGTWIKTPHCIVTRPCLIKTAAENYCTTTATATAPAQVPEVQPIRFTQDFQQPQFLENYSTSTSPSTTTAPPITTNILAPFMFNTQTLPEIPYMCGNNNNPWSWPHQFPNLTIPVIPPPPTTMPTAPIIPQFNWYNNNENDDDPDVEPLPLVDTTSSSPPPPPFSPAPSHQQDPAATSVTTPQQPPPPPLMVVVPPSLYTYNSTNQFTEEEQAELLVEPPSPVPWDMGTLAAAATIGRCGAGSPMVAVIGRGHAAWLVRSLWSDLVRPTLRTFVLDLRGTPFGAAADRRSRTTVAVSVVLSPLLLGVSSPPTRVPAHPRRVSRVGPSSVAEKGEAGAGGGGGVLTIKELGRGGSGGNEEEEAVASAPWYGHVIGARWAATAGPADGIRSWMPDDSHKVNLTVTRRVDREGHHCGRDGKGLACSSVVVPVPQLEGMGHVGVYPDQSVDSEVIVTRSTENRTVIVVVDVEQTHNSRSLAVLSTTTCEFPLGHSFVSLVVMRNWDHHCSSSSSSSSFGSRTFVVKTRLCDLIQEAHHVQEGTSIPTPVMHNVVGVFRVTDTLFCVSFCTNKKQVQCNLYHRDNPTQPLNAVALSATANAKSQGKGIKMTQGKVMANCGFIFSVFGGVINVIEPTSGFLCLALSITGLKSIDLTSTPFSCWA